MRSTKPRQRDLLYCVQGLSRQKRNHNIKDYYLSYSISLHLDGLGAISRFVRVCTGSTGADIKFSTAVRYKRYIRSITSVQILRTVLCCTLRTLIHPIPVLLVTSRRPLTLDHFGSHDPLAPAPPSA